MDETQTYMGYQPAITNEAYHNAVGVSKSQLDAIANKSPMHYWADYVDPKRERYTTDALDVGEAIHLAVLQPDLATARIAAKPKIDRRTNAGKAEDAAFNLEHAGKLILDFENYAAVLAVRDAVHRHPVASGLLAQGQAEESFFGIDPDTGAIIKCRTDFRTANGQMLIDVKSAADASPYGFGKAAGNFRYDVQAAWYPDVVRLVTGERPPLFTWIAIEKEPPYAVGVYYATPEQVWAAARAARHDLQRILHHRETNSYPDYGTEIRQLALPAWVKR